MLFDIVRLGDEEYVQYTSNHGSGGEFVIQGDSKHLEIPDVEFLYAIDEVGHRLPELKEEAEKPTLEILEKVRISTEFSRPQTFGKPSKAAAEAEKRKFSFDFCQEGIARIGNRSMVVQLPLRDFLLQLLSYLDLRPVLYPANSSRLSYHIHFSNSWEKLLEEVRKAEEAAAIRL